MSKLTSQEVIDRGEYLDPGFEPSSLLVVHLRAILTNHDVKYPTNATKAQLIRLFNDNIVPNAGEYRRLRQDVAAVKSDASDIVDGATGEYLEPSPIKRRASRKSAADTPKRVASVSPTRKARRPTTTPRTSTKPEYDEYEVPIHDDNERMAASTPVGNESRKSRRVSQKWGAGDDSSMWEDNNPFQKSASSTPDISKSASKSQRRGGRHSDYAPATNERTNIFPEPGTLNLPAFPISPYKSSPISTPARSPAKTEASTTLYDGEGDETFDESGDQNGYPYVEGDSQTEIIRGKIASLGEDAANGTLARRKPSTGAPVWVQIVLMLLFAAGGTSLWSYKADSASLGYCDAGKNTNHVVLEHLQEIQVAEECRAAIVRRSQAGLEPDSDAESCRTSLIPRATQCTPCPPHAICSVHSITCETAYIPQPSVWSSIPLADTVLNGMPGVGSVAFPPKCVADVRRRQNVGKMARAIENKLASVRGDRICAGVTSSGGDAQDAAAFGMRIEDIRQSLISRIPKGVNNLDDIFNQAIIELKDSGLLVSVKQVSLQDMRGQEVLAAIREEIGYACRAKLFTKRTWHTWQNTVYASLVIVLIVFGARSKLAKDMTERRRVKAIVKEALERVKEQEARHYLDSVGYPSATLSSLQLRDEIMQDEHSIATRIRVWDQVEKIVEGNSNVRSNIEITPSGDEGRVWTWVGAGGRRELKDTNVTGRHLM